MTYSCSWPAALGNNETAKPFAGMIADGCNLWRNWHDIGCGWGSVSSIIDHWGDYGPSLAATGGLHGDPGAAGGGHYHDMDMCVPWALQPLQHTAQTCWLLQLRTCLVAARRIRAPRVTPDATTHAVSPHRAEPHAHVLGRRRRRLVIGNYNQRMGTNCLTHAEEQTQFAIWALSASPLIMGNDLRNVSASSKQILLNRRAPSPLPEMCADLPGCPARAAAPC